MPFMFKVFLSSTMPTSYLRILNKLRNHNTWNNMCRGVVGDGEYGNEAIDAVFNSNGYIAMAFHRKCKKHKYRFVGFATLLTSEFQTKLKDPKLKLSASVCSPDELYIDVVCASPDVKGVGSLLISHVHRIAKDRLHKKRIRLFAIDSAFGYWVHKMGYKECEDACKKKCIKQSYRYPGDYLQGRRLTKCLVSV